MTENDPLAPLLGSGLSPEDIVASVLAEGEELRTPCGEGDLVWHRWGSGSPLVLVHGGSGSWTHWIKQVVGLKDRYEIFAVDLPGLGMSDMPPHPHIPASMGTVLALGIKSLIPKDRRAHVVSFSFGAHVSSHAMVHLQDHVADFTLTGSAALGLPQGPGKEFPREYEGMTEEERLEVHRGLLEILMFKDPSRIDDLAVYLQSENIRQVRFKSRPFARIPEVAQLLPEIQIPVKAVWGGEDQTSWPSVEARYEVIRESHPELITRTIPDAGHWVMYEQPAAYNAALIEVLDA
ncbi:MAG: alpha/beta fold hydrolase [Hyphomicrobiaceae bacterium]